MRVSHTRISDEGDHVLADKVFISVRSPENSYIYK